MKMYGNEENLKDTLFKFKDFMSDHDIIFTIEGGALLGACRNGRLLPWDIDIDVHVPFKSYEDFVDVDLFNLLRDAYKKGFTHVNLGSGLEFKADTELFRNHEIGSLPENEQWKEYLNTISIPERIDKFTLSWKCSGLQNPLMERLDGYIHIDCLVALKGVHSIYEYDAPLDKIKLYGEEFYAPPDHMKYILNFYGENWKDVFCSYSLWVKHRKSIIGGHIPQEVDDFMRKWKPLLEEE